MLSLPKNNNFLQKMVTATKFKGVLATVVTVLRLCFIKIPIVSEFSGILLTVTYGEKEFLKRSFLKLIS